MSDSLLKVGEIVRTHGIKGDVRVNTPPGGGLGLYPGNHVFLEKPEGWRGSYTIAESRRHGRAFILSLKGVNGIREAEELLGAAAYVEKESLPSLPAGEYYWHHLIGLAAETEDGKSLGKVEEILQTGGNDVLVIRKGQKEILIPAIEEVIIGVDLAAQKMIIRPLEGMLSENDL